MPTTSNKLVDVLRGLPNLATIVPDLKLSYGRTDRQADRQHARTHMTETRRRCVVLSQNRTTPTKSSARSSGETMKQIYRNKPSEVKLHLIKHHTLISIRRRVPHLILHIHIHHIHNDPYNRYLFI